MSDTRTLAEFITNEVADVFVAHLLGMSERQKNVFFQEAVQNPSSLKYVVTTHTKTTTIKNQVWERLMERIPWNYIVETAHRAWCDHLSDADYAAHDIKSLLARDVTEK